MNMLKKLVTVAAVASLLTSPVYAERTVTQEEFQPFANCVNVVYANDTSKHPREGLSIEAKRYHTGLMIMGCAHLLDHIEKKYGAEAVKGSVDVMFDYLMTLP